MSAFWIPFGVIVLLTLANGFFAASEIAVVSARRGRLQQRAEAGSRNAQTALDLADEPNRFLATVQVGITLISTFAAAFGGDALADPIAALLLPYVGERYAALIGLVAVVLLITYLSLILGELVPKRLALQRAEGVAIFVAPIMQRISRLALPVVWFLTISTQGVLRALGRSKEEEEQVTEEDVLSLVREGTEAGAFEAEEQEMIERVFDFADSTARSIMTPRTEICALSIDASLNEATERAIDMGFTRLPVYRGSVDTTVGVLHAKDLLKALRNDGDAEPPTVESLMRPAVFVPEHQRISDVLKELKQTQTHLAMVVDEYGQVDGLLTLEDILEELTGDISDEYDEATPMVVERSDGSFLVDGMLSYSEAERRLGLPRHADLADLPPFETIAGLVLALVGHIPTAGETVGWNEWQWEVMDMDGARIDKLLLRRDAATDREQNDAALAMGAVLPPPD